MSDLKARDGELASIRPYRLKGLTVEPRDGTLCGPAGHVQVDPQVMAVLVVLVQNAGRVVTRKELHERVWPGRVVSDDALSRCVYQLRQHMGQAGGSETYRALIETLPKRGYRLNVQEPAANPDLADAAGSAPWKTVALLALMAGFIVIGATLWITDRTDVPSSVTTDERAYETYVRANEYFRRADHRTALPYAVKLYEQAADLDPTFASAWAGLARAHTEMYWHGIDRTPARLNQAEAAIQSLLTVDPGSAEAKLVNANYLLKGLNQFQAALQELALAEASMPPVSELYFLRAMAHRRLGGWEPSIEALNRALDLDPGNITYLRQQYVNHQFVRDYDRAGQYLDRILDLYPDDGTVFVDRVMLSLCRDGDTALFRSFQESAPSQYYDDGAAYTYTSWLAAIYDRNYETAFSILDGSGESQIFDGDFRNASFGPKVLFYARTRSLAGQSEEARDAYAAVIRLVEESLSDDGETDDRTLASRYLALAEAQAGLGQREAALDSVGRATALLPQQTDALMGSSLLLNAAVRVLAPAGYDEEALRALREYLGREGHWSIEGLRKDPRLEALSRSRGFKALERQFARPSVQMPHQRVDSRVLWKPEGTGMPWRQSFLQSG